MLVLRLSLKYEDGIVVRHKGETLRIVLVDMQGDSAGIGFDGPKSFEVVREWADKKAEMAEGGRE